MSPLSAAVQGILDKLATVTDVTDEIPATKFRYGSAESTLQRPYITVNQLYGGDTNRTPRKEADLMVRVLVHSENQTQAKRIKDTIYEELVGAHLDFPSPWGYTAPVTHINDVEDDDLIQQEKVFYYGHDVRVRMAE